MEGRHERRKGARVSPERRAQILARCDAPDCPGIAAIARDEGITTRTIYAWREAEAKKKGLARTEEDERRASDGRWKPGHSGNPGGRSGSIALAKRIASEAAPDMIRRLLDQLERLGDSLSPGQERARRQEVRVIREILDRGLGKPTTHIASEDGEPLILPMSVVIREVLGADVDAQAALDGGAQALDGGADGADPDGPV
jgi:transposase-like protein